VWPLSAILHWLEISVYYYISLANRITFLAGWAEIFKPPVYSTPFFLFSLANPIPTLSEKISLAFFVQQLQFLSLSSLALSQRALSFVFYVITFAITGPWKSVADSYINNCISSGVYLIASRTFFSSCRPSACAKETESERESGKRTSESQVTC